MIKIVLFKLSTDEKDSALESVQRFIKYYRNGNVEVIYNKICADALCYIFVDNIQNRREILKEVFKIRCFEMDNPNNEQYNCRPIFIMSLSGDPFDHIKTRSPYYNFLQFRDINKIFDCEVESVDKNTALMLKTLVDKDDIKYFIEHEIQRCNNDEVCRNRILNKYKDWI